MIFNVTSGGGANGASLTVTAPAGVTATVSKGGKTKSKTTDSAGKAVFKGLESGTWTVTITDGSQTASKQVVVASDYAASLTFFSATIAVTYPAGSVCTCTNGNTTLTAPDTSGSVTFDVDRAGTWTVTVTDGANTASQDVVITSKGQSEALTLEYRLYLYNRGDQCTAVTGGWGGANSSTASTTKGTFSAEESYLYVKNANYASYGAVTKNGVDVTDYTTLHVILNRDTSGDARMLIGPKFPGTPSGEVIVTVDNNEVELTLDITQISGYNKVLIQPSKGLSNPLYIHEVWLT